MASVTTNAGILGARPPSFRAIGELLHEQAATQPHAIALRHGERTVTWLQLDAMADRVAATLQAGGIQPTQTIAIGGANSLEYAAVFLGALRVGVAVALLPGGATVPQLAAMAVDSGARLVFGDENVGDLESRVPRIALDGLDCATRLREWLLPEGAKPSPVEVQPHWPFNIIYSSGTTGTPKGIVQPHSLRWVQILRGKTLGYGPDAVVLLATALYSNTTLVPFFAALAHGAQIVLSTGRFDPSVYLHLAESCRATHATLVPVQYQRLMAYPEFDRFDLSSFRLKFCTSAHFPAALKADVLKRWPGGLIESYGMTEGGGSCYLEAHAHPDKLHTVGRPGIGHDIRLIDEDGRELRPGEIGEVVGRSGAMMIGYQNLPAKTREAEWHDAEGRRYIRTGDVGRFDADGFLQLIDRRKDMIISGGFNIYPSDIEAIFHQHPGVTEVAVVGVNSEVWGESPVAFVVPAEGAPGASALREWINTRLGKIQRVLDVRYIDELPRSEVGKVLKRRLRETYESQTSASHG